MFEEAENAPSLPKAQQSADFIEELRTGLLREQYRRLDEKRQTLLIVVAGIDGAGKGSTINQLNSWMDPRHIRTLAYGELSDLEAMRPAMWRYWRDLPAKGETGVIFGSWYGSLLTEASRKKPDPDLIRRYASQINQFEAMLAQEGVQVVKLWYHLSAKAQKKRTETLLADPDTAWRVTEADLKVQKRFKRLRQAAEDTIGLTHQDHAPWVIIPSSNDNLRSVRTGLTVLDALRQKPARKVTVHAPTSVPLNPHTVRLTGMEYAPALEKGDYESELQHWQARLARAARTPEFAHRSMVIAFEGQDAAGKGGAIRRITDVLDARYYDVYPVAAPSEDERARPYLWRFWRPLPRHGHIAIFDRSWYGRVLVERVEKFAKPAEWQRAYGEINNFEAQMVANGTLVLKFWLAITKDEQLKRFEERMRSSIKHYKITDEDWRNRNRWNTYKTAADEMLRRTDTPHAPWHVVATNDKRRARIEVLKAVVLALEGADQAPVYQEPSIESQFHEAS
ncbi:polyphosphate:AMP phosphotransferase [Corticimicrobacter populi]|uniref:Polyphosphate:AMP phosphotransferase n=1 Tax=Corticimicrobacter populi TaxID=2175229 RepID=A0A2V1JYR4_9BURK|nr:polyphosphate:AMP phosphotransferase [Corticimicrobacter populi]PWF21552.1 polyphosphate:AMP phosphotransferase [Corticimicrobacter populi]